MKVRRRYTQHTLGLATQRSALGHCVQNELHKETTKKINQITSVFWLLMLCLFARGFVIFLILACISFPFLMLFRAISVCGCSFSYMFRQFLTCVWIFLLSLRVSLHCFYEDKSAHIWGAVAFISEGLFPHALPCMQRFSAFFTPLL